MNHRDHRGLGGSRYLYEPFGPEGVRRELEEYLEVLRALGPPEQARERLRAIDEMIEERKRRTWLLSSIKQTAAWATAVTAGWLAVRGLVAEFLAGGPR
jgi:hypothetical protein